MNSLQFARNISELLNALRPNKDGSKSILRQVIEEEREELERRRRLLPASGISLSDVLVGVSAAALFHQKEREVKDDNKKKTEKILTNFGFEILSKKLDPKNSPDTERLLEERHELSSMFSHATLLAKDVELEKYDMKGMRDTLFGMLHRQQQLVEIVNKLLRGLDDYERYLAMLLTDRQELRYQLREREKTEACGIGPEPIDIASDIPVGDVE